jgi:hypothetical protein
MNQPYSALPLSPAYSAQPATFKTQENKFLANIFHKDI